MTDGWPGTGVLEEWQELSRVRTVGRGMGKCSESGGVLEE